MARIIKYNGNKPSDSRRAEGNNVGTTTGIPTVTGSSTTSKDSVNLNRIIWGQVDTGNNINGDILVGGNGYIIDTTNDDPERTLADMQGIFPEGDEGNLYVEKGIKADAGNFNNVNVTENVNTQNIHAESGTIKNLKSDIINTAVVNADLGKITNLLGSELNFDKGNIKELLSSGITTEFLTVTKQAHFFELIIDKIKSAGGSVILTPADGFKVERVEIVNNNPRFYDLLWKADDGEKAIENMWEVGDQALCQTFNLKGGSNGSISSLIFEYSGNWDVESETGEYYLTAESKNYPTQGNLYRITINDVVLEDCTVLDEGDNMYTFYYKGEEILGYDEYGLWLRYNKIIGRDFNGPDEIEQFMPYTFKIEEITEGVSNKYYWTVVSAAGTKNIDGQDYHFIEIPGNESFNNTANYDGIVNPEIGDEIVMLGSRSSDTKRQNAIYIAAYNTIDSTLQAPLICQYRGINDFNLSAHKWSYLAANGNTLRGNLKVESGQNVEDIVTQIETITVEYATSISGTTAPTNGWTTSIPVVPEGYFLWTRTTTVYTNGRTSTSYSISKNGVNGTNGQTFNLLKGTKEFSGEEWNINGPVLIISQEGIYKGCQTKEFRGAGGNISYEYSIDISKSYTFSCYVKVGKGMQFELCIDSGSSRIKEYYTECDWKRVSFSFNGWECEDNVITISLTSESLSGTDNALFSAGWKLEEGAVNQTEWTQSLEELGTVVYKLIPKEEYALVDKEGYLNVNFSYQLVKIVGEIITPVTLDGEDLICHWSNDYNWLGGGDFLGNTSDLVYKVDDFLHHTYVGYWDEPTVFAVTLSKRYNNSYTTIEKRLIPVQYETYAIMSITDKISTEVRNNSGRISKMEQTAEKFEFDLYDPDGEVGSRLELATDKIMQKVNDNYTELSSRGFEINANTVVNGTLTLNNSTQGFILNGNGGRTQITPKSIGSYKNFCSQNSQDYYINVSRTAIVASNTNSYGVTYGDSQIGYVDAGVQISFRSFSCRCSRGLGGSISNNIAEISLKRNGSIVAQATLQNFVGSNFLNYTTTEAGNYTVAIRTNFVFSGSFTTNTVETSAELIYSLPISNQLFNLIGFDGIAMSYNNHYQYFGKEGTYLTYGDYSLKVSPDGIQKYVGSTSVTQQNHGYVTDQAQSMFLSEYAPIHGNAIRTITSGGTSYLQPTDEVILVYNSVTSNVTLNLANPELSVGRRITVRKIHTTPTVTITADTIYPLGSNSTVTSLTVPNNSSVTLVATKLQWIVI